VETVKYFASFIPVKMQRLKNRIRIHYITINPYLVTERWDLRIVFTCEDI
jgi:hypothetical protein